MPSRSQTAIQHTFAALGVVVFAALTASFVLWPRDELPAVTPVSASDYFTAAFIERASDFRLVQSLLGICALLVLLFVPLTLALRWPRVADGKLRADRRSGAMAGRGGALIAAAVGAGLVVLTLLATLPFDAAAFARARDVGLVVQGFGGWIWDWILAAVIVAVIVALLSMLALWLLRVVGRAWWPIFGACVVLLGVLFVMVAPLVISPLFANFEPLPKGEVRTEVEDLAARAGVKIDEVYVVDAAARTTGANAYVAGLGSTRRVVLYDTLIKDFSPAERRQVIAHELAHDYYDDLLVGLIWFAFVAMASMLAIDLLARVLAQRRGVEMNSPAAVAMILAATVVAIAIAQPFANAMSRKVEARADAFALELTKQPQAAIDLERQLTVNNVSRPDPPAWLNALFGTHPTSVKRIGMAVTVQKELDRSTEPVKRD